MRCPLGQGPGLRTVRGGELGGAGEGRGSQLGDRVPLRLRQLGQSIADLGQMARSVEVFLRSPGGQRALLADRVETMVAEIAGVGGKA